MLKICTLTKTNSIDRRHLHRAASYTIILFCSGSTTEQETTITTDVKSIVIPTVITIIGFALIAAAVCVWGLFQFIPVSCKWQMQRIFNKGHTVTQICRTYIELS